MVLRGRGTFLVNEAGVSQGPLSSLSSPALSLHEWLGLTRLSLQTGTTRVTAVVRSCRPTPCRGFFVEEVTGTLT